MTRCYAAAIAARLLALSIAFASFLRFYEAFIAIFAIFAGLRRHCH